MKFLFAHISLKLSQKDCSDGGAAATALGGVSGRSRIMIQNMMKKMAKGMFCIMIRDCTELITATLTSSSGNSSLIPEKMYPVRANDITQPTGVETFRIDIASARSESLNHLFAMMICEFKKMELTDAIMNVPKRIGTNESWPMQANLIIAPKKEMKLATRRT